jgi:hypothetical protein
MIVAPIWCTAELGRLPDKEVVEVTGIAQTYHFSQLTRVHTGKKTFYAPPHAPLQERKSAQKSAPYPFFSAHFSASWEKSQCLSIVTMKKKFQETEEKKSILQYREHIL